MVERMKQGDREAFDSIYEIYQNRILRMAYLIVGNAVDSEDIAQETFVKCFIHCKELKDNSVFKSWLYCILTRTAWEYDKKNKREVPDEEIVKNIEKSNDISSLDIVMDEEQTKVILDAIKQLDIKQRTAVVYYYYNQMSTKEIAKACNCLEGTVKSRLFTARRNLRNSLQEMEREVVSYEKRKQLRQENNQSIVLGK